MRNFIRASALTCAVLCLSLGLASLSPAHAKTETNDNTVQAAQMRLSALGYYVGRFDGNMGPVTRGAIIDFQRTSGLPATGDLTQQTFAMMMNAANTPYHLAVYPDPYVYQHDLAAAYERVAYVEPLITTSAPVMWTDRWHYEHAQALPTRYGSLSVHEDDRGSVRHYVITVNGHAVLFANNQPGLLRVSRTYAMNKEDAVIFTAYEGDGACAYKHYLLTIHNDGSFNSPKEIGNCGNAYEAHVADNALFLSFQRASLGNWDVWRYENSALEHI